MLSQISWADYTSTIIAVTIMYYLFAGGHFYGKDILLYISARRANSNTSFAAEPVRPSFIPDELKAFIAETGDADKESIISGMNYILQRYDIDHPTKNNINSYIKDNCSAHLSDEEMQGIWNR